MTGRPRSVTTQTWISGTHKFEAEMICGLLRSNGIQCGHRETAPIDSLIEEFAGAGPREPCPRAAG